MELVSPGIGLIFWMTLAFGIVLWLLGKYAWKPIMKSLHEREDSIDKALHEADLARMDMEGLKISNEELLKEAKGERDAIMKQAREIKDKLIEDARLKANIEANRIVESARESIENEKMAAMVDLKNQIAELSIEIAEKLLERDLADKKRQKEYVEQLIRETKLN
ncbi:MAG: ATP synthase F0 subunit B [Bacteroidetes bacterium 4484_276]|nr:MAG: ATP synthase F0 subunit B [Bacteroidetes bacterium 4484_276]